jgi:hypothetical protein
LGVTTTGAVGVVLSSAGAGAGANDTGNVRGDRVGELKDSLGSGETEAHVPAPAAFAFAGSASKCTMRFIRFLRGFALDVVVERSGDGWCDEGAGENTGLLEELAPLDGAGAIAVAGRAAVGVAAPPTGTTGGEYALDKGRVEFICSGGGEVRLLLS